jgi:hypothetical protein
MNTRNLFFITLLVLASFCAVAADLDKKGMFDQMRDAVNKAKSTVEEKIGMNKKAPVKAKPVAEEPPVAKEEPVAEEPAEEEEEETETPPEEL